MSPLERQMRGLGTALLMLGTFAVLMVPGFWLRFGVMPWEAL